METKRVVARFMVHKVGSFVVKERVLCFGEYSFSTLDRENQQVTNTWPYEDVDSASVLEGETDLVIHTPRHRIKKTVYRCHFRMEVLVCLMRLRSQHYAKMPNAPQPPPAELQTHAFQSLKCHKSGVQSTCVVEIRPDGIYQRDSEGDLMSHIPYTSLVSIDLICDDHEAIALNHSDNSSIFIVPRRTELAQAINRVMKAYGMQINEYRKKTMEAALKDDGKASLGTSVSFEYQVLKVSQSNESSAVPRTLSVSEKYITEYADAKTVISSRPLSRIYTLIMYQDTLQAFEIVYVDGVKRKYYSAQREKIVCELLASCHSMGNFQVGVEMTEVADSVRMIPRKIILLEGNKIANTVPSVNVMDRELRAAQANILQLLAVHGYRKTARTQRQLPRGLDEEMHSLALELNANTPTSGVIAQPNKPFDKVIYVIARELHDIVGRHGATHDFVTTYLQSLYRLTLAPPAINEFMKILTERGEEYIGTISKILGSKDSVAIYWMFMVLSRLMEAKAHKLQSRQLLLSNGLFMMTLLSLLDEDIHTGEFLSDLPTMKLCQFILLLVKANVEKQRKLSETLYQHLATKYRMMLRILFSFPGLATVEACVGILSRMTKNPAFLHFGNMGSPLRRNNYASSRNNTFSSSESSSSGGSSLPANVVVVQNPEVLLRQYRQFLEAACGSLKMGIDQYDDPVFLRLRYRCRNIFLQELMSHLVGNFEEFKRMYSVDCCQFSGFIGTADGQREKTKFYLTPRALIAVRVVTKHTHEFEFRTIEEIAQATAIPDAFIITVKNKLKFIYSDQSCDIVEKMKALAGIIGIQLRFKIRDKLPKQQVEMPLDQSAFQSNDLFDVQRRTGRHGSTHLRKKKLCFVDGTIEEFTNSSKKIYDLKNLRRVVVPGLGGDETQAVVALEFSDSARVVYAPYDMEKFLAALYDGYRYVENYDVSLSREFSNLNPRMSPRALLKDEHERFLYLNHDGLYIPAHSVLEKEIEVMSAEGVSITSATNRVTFALESLNMNVEMDDFAGKSMRGRLEKLSFSSLLWGINNLLEHSCKPPIRANEICVVLETFCRINDGCYRIAMEQSNGGAMVVVPTLAQILVSGDPIATVWAVNALHSLVADKSRTNGHRVAEKTIRFQVFEHKKLISLLTGLLEQRNPSSTLVMLQLVLDVLVVSRHSTDNNHFDAIVKDLGGKYTLLLELASQNVNAGLAAAVICVLKVIVDHGDHKVRRRICDVALDSGLTITHLRKAFFHPSDNAKETYQYIASIWMTHHKASHEMLVRILPHGFIRMISSPMVRKLLRKQRARQTESVRRKSKHQLQNQVDGSEWFIRRMQLQIGTLFASGSVKEARVKDDPSRMNYPGESSTDMALLSSMVGKDFMLPDLIWNELTRGELKVALTSAIEEFGQFKANQAAALSLVASRKGSSEPKWNHTQFSVRYESIVQELQVDRFYLRVITERINDGSLQLAEVAKIVRAMEAGTHRGKLKNSSSLFFASMDIAKDPVKFFNEVYECWLEHLHLNNIPLSGTNDWSASGSNGFPQFTGATGSEQHGHSMLKILIELANVFPEARPITKHRARFLTELLRNSYLASEIQDIVELMSGLSLSGDACAELCTKHHIQVLLYMSLLSHRRQTTPIRSDMTNDLGDIPMMDSFNMSEANDTSSVPIAELSLYEESRYALKWSIKLKAVGEADGGSTIKGSFSANELKEYLDADPFIRHRQIDALYVCCCSIHGHSGSDEHVWKSMFEYPELRWMELTDESIDPSCAAFALKSLRNFMIKDQRKVAVGKKHLWPPPLVNTVVASTSALALLVQLLLVNNSSVRRYVCEMLMSLSEEELEELYKYGAFYFILATVANPRGTDKVPAFVPETALLKRIHRSQRSSGRYVGQSYLTDMLPESLIGLLDSETPENFADVYSGRKRDKRVLWSSTMRLHLQEMMDEHLREFKESLKTSVTAKYSYTPIPPIYYLELSGDVYCSGFYLSTFNQTNSNTEDVEDPVFMMKSIEEKWRYLARRQADGMEDDMDHSDAYKVFGWSKDITYSSSDLRSRYRELCQQEVEVTTVRQAFDSLCVALERKNEANGEKTSGEVFERILKSQLQLLDKYGFQFFSYESSTLDLLVRVLSSQSAKESKFRSLAMQVLQRLLSVAPQNGPLLVTIDGSWDAVLDLVENCAYGHDVSAKESMFSILKLILTSEEGVQSLLEGDKNASNEVPPSKTFDFNSFRDGDNTSFFTATEYSSQNGASKSIHAQRVYSLLDDVILSFENIQPWHIQKMSFEIASSLCRSRELQEQIMYSTRVFWKGLYLILASAESSSGFDTTQGSTTALEKQERDMLESAFGALRSLALGSDGTSRSAGLEALANLLPMDFLDRLEKPNGYDFCTILLSDIREPTCIWNESTRAELSQLTEEFCTDPNGDGVSFLESAASHMYDCLSSEPFVGGIYLLILLEKSEEDSQAITEDILYPTTAVDFVESLFCFLNENRDPKLGIYSDTMPALDCLSLLCDLSAFRPTIVECLEQHVDDEDAVSASISVATLGRYLLPFDGDDKAKAAVSISSRRSLSTYGFKAKVESGDAPSVMESEFGNVDYLARQEMALLILNKICGFECNLERMLAPFCQFTWCLQVITDHLGYEQAFYALSCLAELCDTCLVIAEYVQDSGLWVEILAIALQSRQHVLHEHFLRAEALREPAFEVLYALLMKDLTLRENMYSGLCRFLPYPIVYQVHLDPSKATRFFDDNHDKSDLIWNSHKRTEVRKKLDQIICRNRVERSVAKRDSVLLDDETDFIPYPHNFVAGLYIDRFLSRPDPEKLTNPAYNLELLFQLWRTQLDQLMGFDLQNPPDNLKKVADEIDKYTMAMTHILRASLDIDESIANNRVPDHIVKLIRYCNQHLITSFPYRCVLRIARRLVQFPEITSKEFVELLICRITMQHPDIPSLLKVLRRVLEARSTALTENETNDDPEYWLKDLKYYPQMLAFLEGVVENKEQIEAPLLSNVNRVLRIIHAEEPKETHLKQISRSFMGRWHNFTLESRPSILRNSVKTEQSETKPPATVDPDTMSTQSFDVDGARAISADVASTQSFDVDGEREPSIRVDIKGIPDDREVDIDGTFIRAPPKSINFAGGAIELTEAIAPRSFRYKGEIARNSPLPSPTSVRYSTLGARYEPINSQYHSTKAVEYDEHEDDEDIFATRPRRGSLPLKPDNVDVKRVNGNTIASTAAGNIPMSSINVSNFISQAPTTRRQSQATAEVPSESTTYLSRQSGMSGMNSERRYSLLDSWKAPTSAAPNSSLTTLTISRRGRRAAAVYSRHKSKKKRWFNR
ncbi:DnaJ sub C member 13 [Phytophthora pseudosyringae]|uniref:DnaJ sub C member 13 n=1 Tax=Phytophthora pseudosyringae TaxID=221518 RepID=A0A8T1W2D3_9STRA|nr:DnaJ sub C member 13 [Phytophthora pseudosyringae]